MGLIECAGPLGVLDLTRLPGTSAMSGTLQIVRRSQLTDLVWPYDVVLDGVSAGAIRNGQTVQSRSLLAPIPSRSAHST